MLEAQNEQILSTWIAQDNVNGKKKHHPRPCIMVYPISVRKKQKKKKHIVQTEDDHDCFQLFSYLYYLSSPYGALHVKFEALQQSSDPPPTPNMVWLEDRHAKFKFEIPGRSN